LEPTGKRLGWEAVPNEDNQIPLLRALILGRLGRAGHKPTVETALAKFEDHFNNKVELHPDLRAMIYGIVARNAGQDGITKLKKIFETCKFAEVERNCIMSLGQAPDEAILTENFKYGVLESRIRNQDLMTLFYGAQGSKLGQDFTWRFFKEHFKRLLENFGTVNNNIFQHIMKATLQSHSAESVAEDAQAFFKANLTEDELKVLDRPIRQSVESIRVNEQLLKKNGAVIDGWLKEQGF